MTKSRDQRSEATRGRILDAAAQLVVELGWDRVTSRAIAARAGVNLALVHYHFGSVDDLVRLAVMRDMERLLAEPIERMIGDGSPADGIHALADWLPALAPDSATSVLSAEALARATREAALREWMAQLLAGVRRRFEAAFGAAQAAGRFDPELSPAAVAALTAALIDGLIFHRLVDATVDVEQVAATLDELLRTSQGRRDI